jgi:hypothetical protein
MDEVDDPDDASLDLGCDESDRLFDFMVAKRNELDENITTRQGFMVQCLITYTFSPY